MYQFIVLSLGFLLLFGGAYLIKKSDRDSGILKQAFSTFSTSKNTQTSNATSTAETIVGAYGCDTKSGCKNPYSLTFAQDGGVYLNRISDTDGSQERGMWSIEQGGSVTIILTDSFTEHYDVPHIIFISLISKDKLSEFVYDSKIYSDMVKPIFTRQSE